MDFSSGDLVFLQSSFAGNTLAYYLIALVVFFVSIVLLRIFKFVIIRHLKSLSAKTQNDLDDLLVQGIDTIGWPFYFVLSCSVALHFITVPPIVTTLVGYTFIIVGTFYAVRIIHHLIDYTKEKMIAEQVRESKDADTSVIDLLANVAKFLVWIIAFLLILSNLGYDITPMIAGLGIGGIAVAFALQNVLSDVFASFSIYFDKPFRVGDTIQIGTDIGKVRKIGIKSTRLESLQGQELIVSNKELTESRINNYKKMQKRRIFFTIGVTYGTPLTKLKKIPDIIKEIIVRTTLAELDRVHFFKFGDFSLLYEIAYFIKSSDYTDYMNTQQQINFDILEAFEKEGIELAYPTQTVYVHKAK